MHQSNSKSLGQFFKDIVRTFNQVKADSALEENRHEALLQVEYLELANQESRAKVGPVKENLDWQRERQEFKTSKCQHSETLQNFCTSVDKALAKNQQEFQAWQAEQQRTLQQELVKYNRQIQLQVATSQRETAKNMPAPEKDNWPLQILSPQVIIGDYQNNCLIPFHIIPFPPEMDDGRFCATKSIIEKRLLGELKEFVKSYYPQNSTEHPTDFLDVDAHRDSKRFNNDTFIETLFSYLKSEPLLILESKVDSESIKFRLVHWCGGQDTYDDNTVISKLPPLKKVGMGIRICEFVVCKICIPFCRIPWSLKLGPWFGEVSIRGLIKCESWVEAISNKLLYSKNKDFEEFCGLLSVYHRLLVGLLVDVHYLIHDLIHDNKPLQLPFLLPEMIKEVPNPQVAKEIIQWVVKGYRDVFDALKKDRSYWVPDLMLELAQELAKLEDKSWAKELVEESNQYWFQLRGIELNQNDNWFNTMKPLLTQSDRNYLEGLKDCWSLLQDHQNIDQTESLLTKLKQEKTMNFSETKTKALEVINQLRDIAKDSARDVLRDDSGKFQKDLASLEDRIKNELLTIGVVGGFNSGKSTLLNALLHRKLLPDNGKPETAVLTTLKYGKEDKATVYYWTAKQWEDFEKQGKEKDQQDKESEITKMVRAVKAELGDDKFNELITPDGKEENISLTNLEEYVSKRYAKSKLVYNVGIETQLEFCKDNIQIVDTPGLRDPEKYRKYIVEIFLRHSDLLVLLLEAGQPFTDADKEFLEEQLTLKRVRKLFVIVNRMDRLDNQQERDAAIEHVNRYMEETFAGREEPIPPVFPMAARQSLFNRIKPTEPSEIPKWTDEESGVPAFEKSLRQFLLEGGRVRALQGMWQSELKGQVVNPQLKQINERLADLEKTINELVAKIAEVHKGHGHLRVRLEKIKADTNDELKRLEREYQSKVDLGVWKQIPLLAGPIAKEVEEKVEGFFRGESKKKDEIETWLEQEIGPFVGSSIQKGLKKVDSDTRNQINEAIEKFLTDVQQSYKDFERLEKGVKFSVQVPVKISELEIYWSRAIDFAFGGVAGAVGTATTAYLFSSSAAFMTTLIGPPGLLMAVIVGAVTVLGGNAKRVKKEIHKQLKKAIPQTLNESAVRWQQELLEQIPSLVKGLREIAEKPALEMQAELEQREADLNQLLEDKKVKEFDTSERQLRLTEEKRQLERILREINRMV